MQSGAVAVCKRKYLLLEEDRKRLETSAKQNKPEKPKNGKRADSYMCLKKYHRACFLFVCFFSVAVTMESIVMSGDSKTTLNHIIIIIIITITIIIINNDLIYENQRAP